MANGGRRFWGSLSQSTHTTMKTALLMSCAASALRLAPTMVLQPRRDLLAGGAAAASDSSSDEAAANSGCCTACCIISSTVCCLSGSLGGFLAMKLFGGKKKGADQEEEGEDGAEKAFLAKRNSPMGDAEEDEDGPLLVEVETPKEAIRV